MKFASLKEDDDMDPVKEAKFRKKFRRAVSDMAQNTAMHGLPNVMTRKEMHKRIFWLFVLLTAMGILIWQITEVVIKYLSYPVSTSTELVFNSELVFPAVTFCNLNPVKMSEMGQLPGGIQNIMGMDAMGKPPRPGGDGATGSEYTAERTDFETFESFYNQFLLMNGEERFGVGHQIEDMLLDCSWKGVTCGPENFTQFNHWQYGNCFTFNSGLSRQAEKTRQPGPIQGLTMKLYVQSQDYVKSLSTSYGVKMVVHNQSSMPFPDTEGFMISTGTQAQVAIKTVFISREDPPHGQCGNFSLEEAKNKTGYIDLLQSTRYTRQGCVNTCKQKEMMRELGCGSSKYPLAGPAFAGINTDWLRPCNWTNDTMFESELRANVYCSRPAQCPDRCVDLQYPVTISNSMWPTIDQETIAWDDLIALAKDTNDTFILKLDKTPGVTWAAKKDFISQNCMIVQLFLEDLSYLSYITAESFGIEAFLSSLGGTFGLWLGMSAVTICELFEFILDLFAMCVKSRKKKVEDSDGMELNGEYEKKPGYPPTPGMLGVATAAMKK